MWKPATDSEKIDHLAGQINGLTAFLMALIATHPNKAALLHEFDLISEAQIATSIQARISEALLEGQSLTRQQMRDALIDYLSTI